MRKLIPAMCLLALAGCTTEKYSERRTPSAEGPASPSAVGPAAADAPMAPPSAKAAALPDAVYQCPMHPDQTSDHAANCPICGMKMVPVAKGAGHDSH